MECPSCGYKNVPIHEKTDKGNRYICYDCHHAFLGISISKPISTQSIKFDSYIQFANKKHLIVMAFILAITAFFFAKLLAIHFSMIVNHFPNEYREGAILLSTKLIVEGGNPYTWANQPEYSNNYGIIYHLVVYPFAKLFGTTLIVHRLVSAFFILASCVVLFIALRRMKMSVNLSFIGATVFYAHLLYFAAPLSRPDSLGIFLFLCSIFIPWKYNYSFPSLLSSIIIGILAFLTKPYFILSVLYVGMYVFLFKSKNLGIKHLLVLLVSLTSTVLLVNTIFECYWNNIFFVNSGSSIHMEYPAYSGIQLYRYTEYNLSIVAILFLMIFNYCKNLEIKIRGLTEFKYKLLNKYIDFTNLHRPLFNIDSLFEIEWIFYMLISLGVFYFKLGRHDGSWLVYIHHLISPFLIILVLRFISKQKLGKFILIFLLCLNLFSLTKPDFLQGAQSDNNAWEEMKTLISQHNNILNSPAIVPLLIEQGKPIYDSGLTEYFQYGIKRNFFGINLPDDQLAKDKNDKLMQKVADTIESKGFDLITMTNHHSLFVSEDNLQKYYQYKKSITVPMAASFQNWKLDIWEPRS